jgi:hypothetical protein
MTADQTNTLRAMADGRWRTITDTAINAGLTEPRAMDAMEALTAEGRLIRERVNGISIYRKAGL